MKKSVGKIVSVEHPIVQKKINESLNLSVREGSVASISTGLGLSYFSPFALALNATASQVGILYAVVSLLPSLIQLKTATLIEIFSRKKIVLTGVLGRILLFFPIMLVGVLFYLGVPHMVWIFIVLAGLFYLFGAISYPAWFSWMGSLAPIEKRGNYFSRRNRAIGLFGITAMVVGAAVLDSVKTIGEHVGNLVGFTLLGFGLIFAISAVMKIWSWNLLKRQYEPKLKIRKKDHFSFWQFLRKSTTTPFGRFVLFLGSFNFVIGISTPFWVIYMLRDLGFSYVWYMLVTVSAIAFQLMFLPLLGKVSDKFGNIKLVKICSWMIVVTPLLWITSAFVGSGLWVRLYLLFVPSIIGGFGWAGYNLAVNNYVYDAVRNRKRGFCLSYMNLIVGLGMFAGASLGSLLAWVDVSFMNPLLFIFAVSAVGRFLVVVFGIRFLHEVRHVSKFSSHYLIREFQPVRGVVREVHHLEHLVKKVEHYI